MGRLMMDILFNMWIGIVLLALWLVWDYTGLRYKVLSFSFLSWLRKIDGDGWIGFWEMEVYVYGELRNRKRKHMK